MINYFSHFQGKKITLMGLGLLGRGLGVARFLIEQGAQLTITDLKTKRELTDSLKKLSKFKGVKYVLGQHRLADFENRDLIIKSAGVPFDSKYIKEAKKNKISIEMDASLFAKLAPVKIIGITGTRGKSTVTDIVYQILKKHYKKGDVFLGGNIKGIATLPFLNKVKERDIVVMELDSWQMQGFGDSKISPHIAVFTNFLSDHMNYYRNSMNRYFDDKANIFKYQSKDDYLIISQQANQEIRKRFKSKIKSKIIKISDNKWETKLLGQHNQNNINLAVEVLKILGINKLVIKKELKTYLGMPGRLEFVRTFKEVDYYNDTNSTTPDALMVALNSFNKKVILIAGGNDKELDYKEVVKVIRKKTKAIILIKGTATD
ncbi:UDP-N-acetylmuramoyl-L-alanine--D-glutamate ligase, partial [Patescibacteria group bacterium]|nr:UDP-N-acetylmuramoyl-L-alanine--D-glutamate ligase [Patescibacteria group bacterium]